MNKHLKILEALLADVSGNLAMGNSKNAAGYLKSLSVLAGALSRQCQQQFELDVLEELEDMAPNAATAKGLKAKRSLNERELELSKLEVELTNYFANVSSSCYISAKHAAEALRSIADDVEKQEGSLLFPRPLTADEMKAWAAQNRIEYIDAEVDGGKSLIAELVAASKSKKTGKAKRASGARASSR